MSQSHKKHKKHKVWPEALSMYKARRLLAAFSILAQFLQLEWHCKPDFLDYLLCFLRGFYPCSWRSCKGPVEPHQIFSFPTWSPLWIQVATAQGNVAQRVHLWYVKKKMPGKPLVMYGQVSVDLAHAKAEFDEQFRSLWIQGHLTWVLFKKFLKRAVQFQHCLDFVVPRTRIIHPLCPKVQKQWAKGLDLSTFPSQFWWTFLLLEHAQFRKASIPGCNLMLGIELNHKIPNQLQVAARFLVGHQLENQEPQNTSKLHTINTQVFAVEPIIMYCKACQVVHLLKEQALWPACPQFPPWHQRCISHTQYMPSFTKLKKHHKWLGWGTDLSSKQGPSKVLWGDNPSKRWPQSLLCIYRCCMDQISLRSVAVSRHWTDIPYHQGEPGGNHNIALQEAAML